MLPHRSTSVELPLMSVQLLVFFCTAGGVVSVFSKQEATRQSSLLFAVDDGQVDSPT